MNGPDPANRPQRDAHEHLDDNRPDGEQTLDAVPHHEGEVTRTMDAASTHSEGLSISGLSSKPVSGDSFGRYFISEKLGEGGFGAVYKAHDPQLDRTVAIKVATRAAGGDQDLFLAEARRLAQLQHSGIVTVHDVGVEGDRCYIVSSFIDGLNLGDWLKQSKPTWQQAAEMVTTLAEALAHAHSQSIIHRDIKPANILLTQSGSPVLVDFGLALSEVDDGDLEPGTVMGTPAYMSPEQIAGRAHTIDGRTDIYSLGVVLYHMLCGRRPFRGKTTTSLFRQIREDNPQPPRQLRPDIPPELEGICLKAMARNPADRFTTAADLAAELRSVLAGGGESVTQSAVSEAAPVIAPPTAATSEATSDSYSASDSVRSSRRRARDAERRQITVLYVCLDTDSSEEFAELDVEDQHEILHAFQRTCDQTAVRYDGTVVTSSGDECLLCFGYPIGYEDAADRAIHTALGIMDALREKFRRQQQEHGTAPTAAAAIHTALTVVSESEDSAGDSVSLVGEARTVATRLGSNADADTILMTSQTSRLTRGHFDTESIGSQKIKGAAEPLEILAVKGVASAETQDAEGPVRLTPLVGRDTEVAVLKDRWEDACEDGGQVVLLIGEAGLGKSRLVRVIRDHVAEESDGAPPIIEWRCSPYHTNTGLYSATDYFERMLKFEREESAGDKLDRLIAALEDSDCGPLEHTVPLFASLLSLPFESRYPAPMLTPQAVKEQTLEALITWLRKAAAQRPTLFILEDLHWIDPSTLDLVGMLIDQTANDNMLSLLTFRPDFETPWGSRSHQTQIALHRLRKRQIAELMKLQTGLKELPGYVVDQVSDRTEGIPLFVEEFTRMVQESGGLSETDGGVEVTDSFSVAGIPATLKDLLIARLDRMDSDHEVAQIGAAIGREFGYELIREVSDLDEPALQEELQKLIGSEVIFEQGRPPEAVYTFKHALIQDAAYDSLLKKKRQLLHAGIAESLESAFSETAESQPELLAHHFTEAANPEKAIGYWLKAGQRSQARFELGEAVSHLTRGLSLVESLPESPQRDQMELGFQLPLGTSLVQSRGYARDEVGQAFERAKELCMRLGPEAPLFHVTWGIWVWRVVRNEQKLCDAVADELLALAEVAQDDGVLMEAIFCKSVSNFYRGEFQDAQPGFRKANELYDEERCRMHAQFTGQNCGSCTLNYNAFNLWMLGFPDQALQSARDAVALARTLDDPFSLAFSIYHSGWMLHYLRLGEEMLQLGLEGEKLSAEQGFPLWLGLSFINQGAGRLFREQSNGPKQDEALALVRQGIDGFRATGAELHNAHAYALLASLYLEAGQPDECERELNAGFALSERCFEFCDLAELHRVRGELLLARSLENTDAARAAFAESFEIATRQGAKSWQLRTSMSLMRLAQQTGEQESARQQLQSVYDTYTEGFDSADLVEARALLDGQNP